MGHPIRELGGLDLVLGSDEPFAIADSLTKTERAAAPTRSCMSRATGYERLHLRPCRAKRSPDGGPIQHLGGGRRRLHHPRAVFRLHEGTPPGEGAERVLPGRLQDRCRAPRAAESAHRTVPQPERPGEEALKRRNNGNRRNPKVPAVSRAKSTRLEIGRQDRQQGPPA